MRFELENWKSLDYSKLTRYGVEFLFIYNETKHAFYTQKTLTKFASEIPWKRYFSRLCSQYLVIVEVIYIWTKQISSKFSKHVTIYHEIEDGWGRNNDLWLPKNIREPSFGICHKMGLNSRFHANVEHFDDGNLKNVNIKYHVNSSLQILNVFKNVEQFSMFVCVLLSSWPIWKHQTKSYSIPLNQKFDIAVKTYNTAYKHVFKLFKNTFSIYFAK